MCVDAANPGMSSFRRVIVPNDITPKFLQVAQRNTGMYEQTVRIKLELYRILRSKDRNLWYSCWCSSKSNDFHRLIFFLTHFSFSERCTLYHHTYCRTKTEWWSW